MKRARLNLLIDAVIGVAFLITAVTGVAFLLPPLWQQAVLVGLSLHAWHWLHDWSGVVAAAGVALHLALHWRWVVHTARRWLAEAHGELPDRRPARAKSAVPSAAGASYARVTDDPRTVSRERAPGARARSGGRVTRRGFLVGAAGFGAALIGGVTISRIASAVGAQTTTGDAFTGRHGAGSTTGSTEGGTGSSSATGTPRVVVDASNCIACGHCMQVCPQSVFAWGGEGRAAAQSPERCTLCRRCVQVCPAGAITLND